MSYSKAKTLSTALLLLSLATYIAGAYCVRIGIPAAQPVVYLATALLAAAVLLRFLWLKCPGCGRRISYKNIKDPSCPYCRRTLPK